MAVLPFSQLPEAAELRNEAIVPAVDDDENYKITLENLLASLIRTETKDSNVTEFNKSVSKTASWNIEKWASGKYVATTRFGFSASETDFKYGSGCIWTDVLVSLPEELTTEHYLVFMNVYTPAQGAIASVQTKTAGSFHATVAITMDTTGVTPGGSAGEQNFWLNVQVLLP